MGAYGKRTRLKRHSFPPILPSSQSTTPKPKNPKPGCRKIRLRDAQTPTPSINSILDDSCLAYVIFQFFCSSANQRPSSSRTSWASATNPLPLNPLTTFDSFTSLLSPQPGLSNPHGTPIRFFLVELPNSAFLLRLNKNFHSRRSTLMKDIINRVDPEKI